MEPVKRGWIGPAPTALQASAVMFVGIVGLMVAGLQPLLLGGLAAEGRLTSTELGRAATAELLTLGLAAGIAGAWLPPFRLPIIAGVAALALAALDFLTMGASGGWLTLIRAAAGVPSGILMWVTIALIARSPTPERWSGAYLTLQTLVQFLWVTGLTAFVAHAYGADGGFASLAILSLVTAAVAFALPWSYAPLLPGEGVDEAAGLPPLRGWFALASCFLYLAFLIGVWVYAEPISRQAGHEPHVVGTAVAVSLACQVLGGFAATILSIYIPWFTALLVCGVLNLAILVGFALLPGPTAYIALSGAFGFLWLFASPFLVPMTIEADPARRAAVLMGGVQLVGGSLGPLIAAELVTASDARGALIFGAVCLVGALGIAAGLRLSPRRAATAKT